MVASRQPSLISVRRDAWLEIDLAALEGNLRVARSWLAESCRLMAVVKSDAYGHGAAQAARVFSACGAGWLGVASVDEGCQLREAGTTTPILILSPSPAWALPAAIEAGLNITVTSASQVDDVARAAERLDRTACVQLKVDTGMHRLGVAPAQMMPVLSRIADYSRLRLTGLFSHLARADNQEATQLQNQCFRALLAPLEAAGKRPPLVHLASGEAARRHPDTHYDMARVGLYLYGLEPQAVSQVVTPAMSVRARINHLQAIEAGESVGYGHTWTAGRPTRLASIPVGYGDGVDRRLSNRMTGLIWGKEVPQVGLISMDQMLFDVTDAPEAQEGDVITLIGSETADQSGRSRTGRRPDEPRKVLYLASWAQMLDTITYELACRLRVRLPRVYTRSRTATGG